MSRTGSPKRKTAAQAGEQGGGDKTIGNETNKPRRNEYHAAPALATIPWGHGRCALLVQDRNGRVRAWGDFASEECARTAAGRLEDLA
jgi:hypothetical protein